MSLGIQLAAQAVAGVGLSVEELEVVVVVVAVAVVFAEPAAAALAVAAAAAVAERPAVAEVVVAIDGQPTTKQVRGLNFQSPYKLSVTITISTWWFDGWPTEVLAEFEPFARLLHCVLGQSTEIS